MENKSVPKDFLHLFKNLNTSPKKLYYKGNLELLNRRKIAIIGSRKMSVYTRNCVLELASLCKRAEICVVSGGALGVDITANKAAMPLSIGIFANGLGRIYPKSNERIIKELYINALALSEQEWDYTPKRYDFLLRNRLIIALSEAVVIAQADVQSGSMQSAKLALKMQEIKEQNQDEFLEFCAKGVSLEQALKHFGEKVYEYELEGKIAINGVFIRVLV